MANQSRGDAQQIKRERRGSPQSDEAAGYFEGAFCQVSLNFIIKLILRKFLSWNHVVYFIW